MQLLIHLLLLATPQAHAAASGPFQLNVSSDPFQRVNAEALSCNDKIYAFLKLPEKVHGNHVLEGRWYKPDGQQQEYTRVPLALDPPGHDLLYLWLVFERSGDAVDVFFTHNDDDHLDGRWTLDVFWDGEKVATHKFTINCV